MGLPLTSGTGQIPLSGADLWKQNGPPRLPGPARTLHGRGGSAVWQRHKASIPPAIPRAAWSGAARRSCWWSPSDRRRRTRWNG